MGKSISVLSTMEKETQEIEFDPGVVGSENDRFVLRKVKEKESSDASGASSSHQIVTSSVRGSPISTSRKNHASGPIIRSLLRKEGRMDRSYTSTIHTEQRMDMGNVEDKHPPLSPSADLSSKDHTQYSSSFASFSDGDYNIYTDDVSVINNKHVSVSISEKHDRRTRNKEIPDHGVWAPLRHPSRSQSNDGIPSSSEDGQGLANSFKSSFSQQSSRKIEEEIAIQNACVGQSNKLAFYETWLCHGERKTNLSSAISEDLKVHGGGRVDYSSVENGSHRYVGRRGSVRGPKDVITSVNLSKGKSFKRGSTFYTHERQVWVQKSGLDT